MRRDDEDVEALAMDGPLPAPATDIVSALSDQVTAARWAKMEAVAAARTARVVAVLDDLADPHNAAAVLRSADAFGVHQVHFVAGRHTPAVGLGVAKGAQRWLSLKRHASVEACAGWLRSRGYRIFVAQMGAKTTPVDLARSPEPVAVVFGNEHHGPQPAWDQLADGQFAIPMCGFVQSLNVSVAAAITLCWLRSSDSTPGAEPERQALLARYLLRSVRNASALLEQRGVPVGHQPTRP